MQAIYHYYYVTKSGSKKKYRVDLRDFFRRYAGWSDPVFKGQFTVEGDHLFLLRHHADVHLFAMTRDTEVIKQIRRDTLDVADLLEKIGRDNSVGFASYVLVEADHIAFASKVLSPRSGRFADYVNAVLQKLEIGCTFHMEPVLHSITKSQVSQIKVAGSFSMRIRKESGLWGDLLRQIGVTKADKHLQDLGELVVTVKSKARSANTAPIIRTVAQSVDHSDLSRFDVKAKLEVAEKLTDLHIVGQGALREALKSSKDSEVALEMINKVRGNGLLTKRLEEFRTHAAFKQVANPADLGLDWAPPGRRDPGRK